MQISIQNIAQSISTRYLREPMIRQDLNRFKEAMVALFSRITTGETEEHYKNLLADFLQTAFYAPEFEINTKDRQDLAIHVGKQASYPVGVILEVKRPDNKAEMFSPEKPNAKALHELIHYFLQERQAGNQSLTRLIITNLYEWYAFDAMDFERLFFQHKPLRETYQQWQNGQLAGKTTEWLYKEILAPFCEKITEEINVAHCHLKLYEAQALAPESEADESLRDIFKFFSPPYLLKLPFGNDANELNKPFYYELLHILGLTEVMEDGIPKIKRKKSKHRDEGSLLENVIRKLEDSGKTKGIENEAELFETAFELVITWLNRILFLKLLEGQLWGYHDKNPQYAFLRLERVPDFEELDELFFEIFNKKIEERREAIVRKFPDLPYLNSGLFEMTELEKRLFTIACLKNKLTLPVYEHTVLKDAKGVPLSQKKDKTEKRTLEYLFEFLDSYNFGSEGKGKNIRQDSRTIMNAAVLGLVFEKINGYQEGAFFTPHFITEYMCRETVRKTMVAKFRDSGLPAYLHVATFEDLQGAVGKEIRQPNGSQQANDIINSIRICDPAVGSGHFLVSVLNEMIWAKYELYLLRFADGKRAFFNEYELVLENDELYVYDAEVGKPLAYRTTLVRNYKAKHITQQYYEMLFREKQTIIENCLFGVDINPNSASICRLRLWIELLKNAHYTEESKYKQLQTLPNLEINIRAGNSLVSRFGLNGKNNILPKDKPVIKRLAEEYKLLVRTYKESRDTKTKNHLRQQIQKIKQEFEKFAFPNDKDLQNLRKKEGDLAQLGLGFDGNYADLKKIEKEFNELHEKYTLKLQGIYRKSFEWRFEFPEILNDEGDFIGFDMVIGNPPYIRQEFLNAREKEYYEQNYPQTGASMADIYVYFFELACQITKAEGNFAFIVPNKWLKASYGKGLRSLLKTKKIEKLLDFGDNQIFESATTYTCVTLAENREAGESFEVYQMLKQDYDTKRHLGDIAEGKFFTVQIDNLSEEVWLLNNATRTELLKRLSEECVPLAKVVKTYRGIVTGLTEAFIIEEEVKNELIKKDSKSSEILKPVLRGRNIQPYQTNFEHSWLIATFPVLKLDIENYPAIKDYFTNFGKERLEQTGTQEGRKKTSYAWFETQDGISYWQEFEKPKIMYQVLQVKPCFIYDEQGFYCNNSMWIIPTEDKSLLGIFNSRMGWFLISQYCTAIQNGFQLIFDYFGKIPIPVGKEEQRQAIAQKVDEILACKKADAQADTQALEREIDALVYALYGLSEAEIAEVEAS